MSIRKQGFDRSQHSPSGETPCGLQGDRPTAVALRLPRLHLHSPKGITAERNPRPEAPSAAVCRLAASGPLQSNRRIVGRQAILTMSEHLSAVIP
jgi:hypothetical protein